MNMCGRTVLLHDTQELGDDFGAGSDHDLALACLLGVVDALQRIVEDRGADHGRGIEGPMRFSSRGIEDLRYLQDIYVSLQKPRAGRVPNQGFFSSCRKRRRYQSGHRWQCYKPRESPDDSSQAS